MSFATSDVTQKLNHIQKRTQEMISAGMIGVDSFSRNPKWNARNPFLSSITLSYV